METLTILENFNFSISQTALKCDPDLSTIPPQIFRKCFKHFMSQQAVNTHFYRYFYQHAEFVTSTAIGKLADIQQENAGMDMGYLSFL